MGAGLGFKTFVTGDVLTAGDTNGYLMQGVWVFANAAARDAAVTSPQEGNTCYLKDTDNIMVYSGSAWVTKSATGSSGALTYITSATFTSATSTSVNTCFSSTYENYVINLRLDTSSVDGYLLFRFRSGTTDTTTGYGWSQMGYKSSGADNSNNSSATSIPIAYNNSGANSNSTTFVYRPNLADESYTFSNGTRDDGAQSAAVNSWAGRQNTSTAFDGFTMLVSSGTFTGKVYVYGVANS